MENDSGDARIRAIAAELASEFEDVISDIGLASPIERIMAAGILYAFTSTHHLGTDLDPPHEISQILPWEHFGAFEDIIPPPDGRFVVLPQFPIGKYTADFLVLRLAVKAVIECDGHDFHERTKAQAEHDKKRDRYFQSLGLIVLRYTGSEIYRDPIGVALSALEIINTRARAPLLLPA